LSRTGKTWALDTIFGVCLATRRSVSREDDGHFASEILKAANHRLMAKYDNKFGAPRRKTAINMTIFVTSFVARGRAGV
jgi:hypothetical protein